MVGFLGKSARAGYWRLYLTQKLNDYIEFHEDDVVHSQSLATERNPLGGTVIWVKRDAKLLRTRTTTVQAQAEFFRGDIMSRFLVQSRRRASLGFARFMPQAGPTAGCSSPIDCTGLCTVGLDCPGNTGEFDPNCNNQGTGAFDPNCCAVTDFPDTLSAGCHTADCTALCTSFGSGASVKHTVAFGLDHRRPYGKSMHFYSISLQD